MDGAPWVFLFGAFSGGGVYRLGIAAVGQIRNHLVDGLFEQQPAVTVEVPTVLDPVDLPATSTHA